MDGYKKSIEVADTGMVIASVCCGDGRRVGINFFCGFLNTNSSVRRRLKKAHKWADDRIRICQESEVNPMLKGARNE